MRRTGWQQTGFRADKALLNRFRSKLALEERAMGPVLEEFIEAYVKKKKGETVLPGGGSKNNEWSGLMEQILEILNNGGEAADYLSRTTLLLIRLVRTEANEKLSLSDSNFDSAIEETERMAEEVDGTAEQDRDSAESYSVDGGRTTTGRKRVVG